MTCKLSNPTHHMRLTKEAKLDLKVWQLFIESFNGTTMFLPNSWESESLNMYTDASNLGFGGIFGCQWFNGWLDDSMMRHHINIKELFPIVIALEYWGNLLRNKSVLFFSDNTTVVAVINKQTSPNTTMMVLVRRLVFKI